MGGALTRAHTARNMVRGTGGSGVWASRGAPSSRQYSNPCFMYLVAQTEPVTQALFGGRFADAVASSGTPFRCPAHHELYHAGRVVARGVVDADCELIPRGKLPPHFSAVTVRSMGDDCSDVPCWSWGNGTLAKSFLSRVSVHTLVWQTRMTGYVSSPALRFIGFSLCVYRLMCDCRVSGCSALGSFV